MMSSLSQRYRKLGLREALENKYRYPYACKELAFILRAVFHQFPKAAQYIVFDDILSAFRLLPEMQTQSAVSAVHFLLHSVEKALPKQKRTIAVTEFKHAMVAHKRRHKAQQTPKDSLQLPQDMLVHIFSFLDMQSLILAGLVCRSWNIAANDNHLWEMQYLALYGSSAKQPPMRLVEDKNNRLLQESVDTRTVTDWKQAVKGSYTGALSKKLTLNRGYCRRCKCIVWLNNSKCSKARCEVSEKQHIKPLTAFQLVGFLLNEDASEPSSSDSDSDSEEGRIAGGCLQNKKFLFNKQNKIFLFNK